MKNIILLLFFALTINANSQQKLVKGTIKDMIGRPILGGTFIKIKGKSGISTSDNRGEYYMKVHEQDTLVFSYPGFPIEEIAVKGKSKIDVVLKEELRKKEPLKAGKRKVVFILVDGISTDMYYRGNTPYLDKMSKEGAFSPAYVGGARGTYSETPTISAVGYNSMLTGVWVNKHNVLDNDIADPNYNYPTLFRVLKDQNPEKKIAVFSTWEDNRTKLIGENLPQTNNIKMDYYFDGMEKNFKKYPHDKNKKYLKRIDAEVALNASNYIYENGPDMSWVYLEHSDDMGHLYGESKEIYEAISYEDALVGMIWDAVKLREAENDENWLVVVTTDHGRRPIDGKHHGYQSERERSTWIAVSKPIDNFYFQNNNVAIVDIFPTVCDFMNINVAKDIAYEVDGLSFMKKIDAIKLEGRLINRKFLNINWLNEHLNDTNAKILVSYTNNYQKGEKDNYMQIGKVNILDKAATFEVNPPKDCNIIKVILETPNHTLNTWVEVK